MRINVETGIWSNAQKALFLAVLAHELTVGARGTYEVGTSGVKDPKLLRAFNEILHRVTASLREYQQGREGIPLSTVLKMLKDFGTKNNRQSDIERAISSALSAI
jgi:hypothetical protein